MKIAFVFNRNGRDPVLDAQGEPTAFPVFKWLVWVSDGQGRWQLHLAAHMCATTEDFRFQQYHGVLAIGRNARGLWFEFSPGRRRFHIGA